MSQDLTRPLATGLVLVALGHALVCLGAWAAFAGARWWGGVVASGMAHRALLGLRGFQHDGGLTGHRTALAGLLAITAPLALGLGWRAAAVVLLAALWRASSYAGLLGGALGLAVLYPPAAPWIGGGVGLFVGSLLGTRWWQRWLPRDDSLDGVVTRVATWGVLLRTLSWGGSGVGGAGRAVEDAWARTRDPRLILGPDPHCLPLWVVHEGGAAAAALVVVGGAGLLTLYVRLGDPWSAAVLAGLVPLGTARYSHWVLGPWMLAGWALVLR